MNGWETVTWTVARAGGLTAYILLTLAVALGLALSLRWQAPRWPRLITNELHRFVTLLSLIFIAVHGLAVWLDPFTRFGWSEVLVPLLSHYRPLWMALGIVAAYLALALWVSTELRPVIGYTWWRRLHGFAFAVYALSTVHGIGTGSDTQAPWALGLYAGSVLLVGTLLVYRLLTPIGARGRAYPRLAGLVAVLVLGGAIWTVRGPARAGWNVIANNGQGNGSRAPQAAAQTGSTATGTWATPFSATLQGTLSMGAPDSNGDVTVRVEATLSGGAQGTLDVLLQGATTGAGTVDVSGGQVTLTGAGGSPSYQGTLQSLNGDGQNEQLTAVVQAPGASPLTVQCVLVVASNNGVSGTVQVSPAPA